MAHRMVYDCLESWKLVIEQHPARLQMCYFLSLNSVTEIAAIDIVVFPETTRDPPMTRIYSGI